jgi:hypothetical protein
MTDESPEPKPANPAVDRAVAVAVIEADRSARMAQFAGLVRDAETVTGCEFVQSVMMWVEAGVVRCAPRLDVRDRTAGGA